MEPEDGMVQQEVGITATLLSRATSLLGEVPDGEALRARARLIRSYLETCAMELRRLGRRVLDDWSMNHREASEARPTAELSEYSALDTALEELTRVGKIRALVEALAESVDELATPEPLRIPLTEIVGELESAWSIGDPSPDTRGAGVTEASGPEVLKAQPCHQYLPCDACGDLDENGDEWLGRWLCRGCLRELAYGELPLDELRASSGLGGRPARADTTSPWWENAIAILEGGSSVSAV